MLEASNFVLLCIMPGPDSVAFVEAIKPLVAGRGVCFVDMSASYTRFYTAAQARERPPSIPSLRPRLSLLSLPRLGRDAPSRSELSTARRARAQRAPAPHQSHLTYLRDVLADPSASWVKAWANVMAGSISGFRTQPMEVAGDPKAKAIAFRMLAAAGFEPLDCGGADDAKGIEPCSAPYDRPERWRHPRHLEHNGPNHP